MSVSSSEDTYINPADLLYPNIESSWESLSVITPQIVRKWENIEKRTVFEKENK
jgi:hypothetical protein